MPLPFVRSLMSLVREDNDDQLFRAVITSVSGNLVGFKRLSSPKDQQLWATLQSYTPVVDDEVVVARLGDGFVVMGEITT